MVLLAIFCTNLNRENAVSIIKLLKLISSR